MGARGPIPKRDDQLRRPRGASRGGQAAKVAVVTGASKVAVPPADDAWHPMARAWYGSLAESGQHAWYEPSDWQVARVWAEVLSRQLAAERISAVMVQAWAASASELLTTEGARRRARLELERAGAVDEDADACVVAMERYRQRLGPPS